MIKELIEPKDETDQKTEEISTNLKGKEEPTFDVICIKKKVLIRTIFLETIIIVFLLADVFNYQDYNKIERLPVCTNNLTYTIPLFNNIIFKCLSNPAFFDGLVIWQTNVSRNYLNVWEDKGTIKTDLVNEANTVNIFKIDSFFEAKPFFPLAIITSIYVFTMFITKLFVLIKSPDNASVLIMLEFFAYVMLTFHFFLSSNIIDGFY